MSNIVNFFVFASAAHTLRFWGASLLVLAVVAGYFEKRRVRRLEVDNVGWMPWFGISFAALIIGAGLLTMSLKEVAGQ